MRRPRVRYPLEKQKEIPAILEWIAYSCLISTGLFMLTVGLMVFDHRGWAYAIRTRDGISHSLPFVLWVIPAGMVIATALANPFRRRKRPRRRSRTVGCILENRNRGNRMLQAAREPSNFRDLRTSKDRKWVRRIPIKSLFRFAISDCLILLLQASLFSAVLLRGVFDSVLGPEWFQAEPLHLIGIHVGYFIVGLVLANEIRAEAERKAWPSGYHQVLFSVFGAIFIPAFLLAAYSFTHHGPFAIMCMTGVALIFWFAWHSVTLSIGGKEPACRASGNLHVPPIHSNHGSTRQSEVPQAR